MKKLKIQAPRKLVLRREAIAQLTRAQLGHVAGAIDDQGNGCSLRPASCSHSNVAEAVANSCVVQ
jgi:hypothetical protein